MIFHIPYINNLLRFKLRSIKWVLLLTVLLWFRQGQAQNPALEWVHSNKGTNSYPFGRASASSVAVDSGGNTFTIGSFEGDINFQTNPALDSTIACIGSIYYNGPCSYIQKLDSSKNFIWARSISGVSVREIAVDQYGDVYIAGQFAGTVDVNPDTSLVYTLASQGNMDVFILKLSSNGQFLWAKSFGGTKWDNVNDICIDKQGHLITVGSFYEMVDFDPGPGTFYLNIFQNNNNNSYIQKLDSSGQFVWAGELYAPQNGYSRISGVETDSQSNIYVSGEFRGIIDFDPDTSAYFINKNHISVDQFVLKLDSSGRFRWVWKSHSDNGHGYSSSHALALDNDNNIYCIGVFSGLIDFDPSVDTLYIGDPLNPNSYIGNVFIYKLNSRGILQWVKTLKSNGSQTNYGLDLCTDTIGNLYATGQFIDTVDFDPGPDTSFLIAYLNPLLNPYVLQHETFILKLNTNGELLWAKDLDASGRVIPSGIVLDQSGNIYTCGTYSDTVDFDPDTSFHLMNTYNYESGSYLLKLNQCSIIDTAHVVACDSVIWLNGVTYYQPTNSAYFTLAGNNGCDSILYLSLSMDDADVTVSVSNFGGTLTANQSGATYQWLDCNNGYAAMPGDTLQTFSPTQNGNYAVVLNYLCCIDTSECITVSTVDLGDISLSNIVLYPNPNNGKFTIEIAKEIVKTEIRIYNSLGQEILIKEISKSETFDLDLKPGVYIVRLKNEEAYKRIKFIIE